MDILSLPVNSPVFTSWLIFLPVVVALTCVYRIERLSSTQKISNSSSVVTIWQVCLLLLLSVAMTSLLRDICLREPDSIFSVALVVSLAYMVNRAGKVIFFRYGYGQVRFFIIVLGCSDFVLLLSSVVARPATASPAYALAMGILMMAITWALYLSWIRRVERWADRAEAAARIEQRAARGQ